ncbi:MAG: PilN domain-containing protein [Eubacteriaceae bacterium]|nr:PilN domain-containing protein [Eubacteriaceae bacterium]
MRDINMLPDEIFLQKVSSKKRAYLLVRVLIFLGILAVLYAAMYTLDLQTKNETTRTEAKIATLSDVKARKIVMDNAMAELANKEKVLSTMDKGKTNFFDLLATVEATVPSTVQFTKLAAENGVMKVNGVAGTREEVAELAAMVSKIKNVENTWITSVKTEEAFTFELTFTYNKDEGGAQQ